MKRTDAQIYIFGHKPLEYGYWDNELYTPLQVGAEFHPPFTELRDNQGDNIGIWNPVFAESTGLYWVAHNAPESLKYLGNCQYRRRLQFPADVNFDALFEQCEVIVSEPLAMNVSVAEQYKICHSPNELETVKSVVLDLYPEYKEDWDSFIENGKLLLYSSGFVMRREHYAQYADFFTTICFETLKRMGLKSPADVREYTVKEIEAGRKRNTNGKGADKGVVEYQQQLAGFWQERLSTLFIFHNFKKIAFMKFVKFENI